MYVKIAGVGRSSRRAFPASAAPPVMTSRMPITLRYRDRWSLASDPAAPATGMDPIDRQIHWTMVSLVHLAAAIDDRCTDPHGIVAGFMGPLPINRAFHKPKCHRERRRACQTSWCQASIRDQEGGDALLDTKNTSRRWPPDTSPRGGPRDDPEAGVDKVANRDRSRPNV
jgi:hypothetical protein